jgi:copper homeostasis protein
MNFTLEVIAFDIESCIIAEKTGAHRIELCDNQAEGGTTPSFGLIHSARKNTTIELFPIIRPRGGDFLYSEVEFDIMKEDVLLCKKTGCDGVVLGLLNKDGSIDKKRTSELVNLAYPMSVTFHRAFDRSNNPIDALEDIISTGCERILTSGQCPTALEGIMLIEKLIKMADDRIIIMPGSGIHSKNIKEIALKSKAKEFHSSARTFVKSQMEFHSSKMNDDFKSVQLNEIEVKAMLQELSSI